MKITTFLVVAFLSFSTINAQENTLSAPQQEQTSNVSKTELKQFASIYGQIQEANEQLQETAIKTIEKEGLSVEEYNQIANTQSDPNLAETVKESDLKTFNKINDKVQVIQEQFQVKATQIIEKEGLTLQRYQEVFAAIQQNPNLQQQLTELING